MRDHKHRRHFVEHILQLLDLLHASSIGLEELSRDTLPLEGLSPERAKQLQTVYDFIAFMDEIPAGLLIYRAEGNEEIVYANQGVLSLFRCNTMEELLELTGGTYRGMVYQEDLAGVERSIRQQIFDRQRERDYAEYRIRCKDGSLRWVEDYGRFIHEESGDVFFVFLEESTDERTRIQMEQKRLLAEALSKANLAVQAKNTFLSHISHDMRTPLNAIFGFTTLAKESLHDAEAVRSYLEKVDAASHTLLDMITQVLDVSSLSNAAGPAEVECDFCETIRDIYDFLLPQAQEKSIDFQFDCDGVNHSGIYADQEKLRQLALSLANNAVTYTPPGGKVEITLSEERDLPNSYAVYRLVFRDNGVGISAEFLERIFEPFSRERSSTLSGVHGVGLGLTIAKSIVDMMDGAIEVESAVNQGSTFVITLTFRIQPVSVVQTELGTVRPSQRLLLVEDNEINLEIEEELLQRMGFLIDPAENGKIALDKVAKAAPGDYDLMIMDLQMPVMDGWEASAAIRKLPDPTLSRIPIIALSANVLQSDQRKSRECGINVHLPKPLELPLLLDTIKKLTGRSPA